MSREVWDWSGSVSLSRDSTLNGTWVKRVYINNMHMHLLALLYRYTRLTLSLVNSLSHKPTPFFSHKWAYFVLPLLVYATFSTFCLPFSTTIHLKAPCLDGSPRPLWRWCLRRILSPMNRILLQPYFPRLLATGLILFRVAQPRRRNVSHNVSVMNILRMPKLP